MIAGNDKPAPLAWGAKVSPEFRTKVKRIAARLDADPSWLMAAMAFETAETFSPAIHNAAGSGATGLIQFMPVTALSLGTNAAALAHMSAEAQLDYVEKYFRPWQGRLHNLGDVYCAILFPLAVGKRDDFVLFRKGERPAARYRQNAGLDGNRDGTVTRGEAVAHIRAEYEKGLTAPHVWPRPNDN